MKKLIKNCIRCKLCGDIITSETTHDFKCCKCGACAVDGGLDYLRRCGDIKNWEDLSEYVDKPGYYITHWTVGGIKYNYATTKDINPIIKVYEDMWGYVMVEDEDHNVIYKTFGLDEFLKKHGRSV